jgi:serine/threonine-protein kinase
MTISQELPPGTLLAGKFRVGRLLGAGAMGAVYEIHHELTRHKRALKLLHGDVQYVSDIVRRFLNEASAAGRAGNPHLVETFDAGTLPTGEPYVVMELLEGETLASVLERERYLDVARAVEIVAQAAEGIDAAHRVGIIHRDLKPENLFITLRDKAPFVKILDFGVSKFATASVAPMQQTRAGMLYGSPAYMSPEQLRGETDVDARADVFALGVVLYQCLAGVLPFDAPTVEALIVRALTRGPEPLDAARPELPAGLIDVIGRALAPSREARISTARALAEALLPFRPPAARSRDAELGFATTVSSQPPSSSREHIPKRVLGVSPARFTIAIVFVLLLTGTGAVLLAAHRKPLGTQTASNHAPEVPPARAVPVPNATPAIAPASLPPASAPTKVTQAPPSRRVIPAGELPSAVAPTVPSPSSSERPSTAESLRLHQDNPFR